MPQEHGWPKDRGAAWRPGEPPKSSASRWMRAGLEQLDKLEGWWREAAVSGDPLEPGSPTLAGAFETTRLPPFARSGQD